jgi:hypothetical protein
MTQRYIERVEDQTVSFSISGKTFMFHFFAFRGLMYVDVSRQGEYLIRAKRIMPNRWLIPEYMTNSIGNIRFETYKADEEDYVWYEEFNTKFRLMSYRASEIADLEAGIPVTEDSL